MEILLAFLLVLGLVTLIGHGIWVFLAALGRALFGSTTKTPTELRSQEQLYTPPRATRFCDDCGAALDANGNVCASCGKTQTAKEDAALNDLDTTERQLRRWRAQGVLDEMKFHWLAQVVAQERQRLTQPAPPPPPKPVRAEPIPVPAMPAPPPPLPREVPAEPPLSIPVAEDRPAASPEPQVYESPFAPAQAARVTTAPPPEPPAPRKSLTEMLAAFMEEKNIRWGELLGGMLIIGCSLALVISLWAQIEQIPLLKFFIFTAMTGAFAGLGFYSEHRWKLPNTSRGLLITATMLVPLNFLAIAAFAKDMSASNPMVVGSELISLALFVLLVYRGGNVIMPGWQHWLTLGVVGTAATQLLLRRVIGVETTTIVLCAFAALPIACYALASLGLLRALRAEESLESKRVNQAFILLSASSFAALVTLGLLLFKTQAFVLTLQRLAPMVSLLALPALFLGIGLWQRTRKIAPPQLSLISLSIAVFSVMVMLASLVFAWPNATLVLLVALINFAALTFVAFAFRLPVAHLAALPCFVLAFLLGVQLVLGHIGTASLLALLVSVTSAKALALLFVVLVGACEGLLKWGRKRDGFYYAVVTAAVGVLSLLLASLYGFGRTGDPQQIAWVYAVFAAAAFYLAYRMNWSLLSYGGLGLAFLASVQGLYFGLNRSFKLTTLLFATVALTAALALRRGKTGKLFAVPSQRAAWMVTILAGVVLWLTAPVNTAMVLCGQTLWLAGLVVAVAWLYRSPVWFTAFQALTYAAVFFAVTATTHGANLLATLPLGLRSLRPQMLALALLSPVWIVLRLALRKIGVTREAAPDGPTVWQSTAARLLYPAWPMCDQVVTWVLVAGFVALSLFGVVPGLLAELAPTLNLALSQIQLASATEWMLLGALLFVLTISLWEQFTRARVLGILLLLAMVAPLLAQSSVAAATTWRWAAAAYLLLTACALWGRERIYAGAQSLRLPLMETEAPGLAAAARGLTLLLAGVPIIGLTLWAADLQIGNGGWRVPGEWLFARFGAVGAYLVPLVVLSLVLVGHAVRERRAGFALAGSLVLNFAASLTFLNTLAAMTETAWVRLAQINAITSAVFALCWLGAIAWQRQRTSDDSSEANGVLKMQVWLGAALSLAVVGLAGAAIFINPTFPGAGRNAVGSGWGWLAFALSGVALVWFKRLHHLPVRQGQSSFALLAIGVLLACTLSRWDLGTWLGYHTLLISALTVPVLLLLAGFWQRRQQSGEATSDSSTTIQLTSLLGGLAFVLGARSLVGDPQNPWWAVASFAVLSALAAGLAWLARGRGFLYVAGMLVNLAVSVWHGYEHFSLSPSYWLEFVAVNVIALALAGLALFMFERKAMSDVQSSLPPYHHYAAILSLIGVAAPVLMGLARDYASVTSLTNFRLGWIAIVTTIVLMGASLWDVTAKYAVGGLYVLGLVVAGMALDQVNLEPRSLLFLGAMLVAGYVVITSWLWAEKQGLEEWAATLGIPRRIASASSWLVLANTGWIVLLTWVGAGIVLQFEVLNQRLLTAFAVAAQSLSFVWLARGSVQRAGLQTAAFGSGLFGAIFLGWAFLSPGLNTNTVTRIAIVMIVSVAALELLGLWFIKRFANEWGAAAKRLLRPLCGIAVLALGSILVGELSAQFFSGKVEMPTFVILSVVVVLFGLSMQAIYFAVRAERDPLQLSERGRMNYVYASEALLGLTFLHIRLTMPWLFSGFFTRYWPFVVMALAFVGVGLGELFRRRGQRVLGQPLLNTGFFLPLFPVVGFWLVASKIDYSGLLLAVGILYAVVAVLRGSFVVSLLACLAANGSLWYFLSRLDNFSLLERPQLWLMPAALSVLIAAYLNRSRLSAAQMTNLRYITLSVIYVSSTAEIFIRGVALSPWQPMVLLLLSAAGVLAGILLRVRAFLYLGASFLLISIVSMIWHAAANFGWTWLWYVTGILAGLAIILLFAMFEKKRSELLRLVEGLRTWEA